MSWTLAAFYIKKHRQFGDEITINLGGEFFYEFESLTKENLSIIKKQNTNYIKNFFGKGISNLSVLVGANGSGKTSLFTELLTNKEVLLVFELDGQSSVIYNNYLSEISLRLNKLNFDENNQSVIQPKKLGKSHLGMNIGGNAFHSPKYSYFNPQSASNYFLSQIATVDDQYKNPLELNALRLQRSLLMFSNKDLMDTINSVYNDFPEYDSAVIYSNKLSDELLWSIELEISGLDKEKEEGKESFEMRLLSLKGNNKYTEKVNFLNRYKNKNTDLRYNVISKLYVMARILAYSMLRNKKTDERIDIKEPYLTNSKLEFSEIRIKQWLISLRSKIGQFKNGLEVKRFIDLGLEWFNILPINEEIDLESLNVLIENKFLQKQQELNSMFFGANDYVPYEIISRRIDFELSVISPSYSLSQGEENLLNLLSNFYVNENLNENRPQIILLDEATSGFHPKWQKKFVRSITQLLPLIFKSKIPKFEDEKYRSDTSPIQIIFTSHDPFPLSDIPRCNITYLYKDDGLTKPLSQLDVVKKKSFGANITDLLEDSFFLGEGDDSLVGEFAQDKINAVIHWINKENEIKAKSAKYKVSDRDFENNKKIISLIDEPILQIKLAEMLDELKGNKQMQNEIIDARIKELENKRNELNS